MNRYETAEPTVHALRSANPAVKTKADSESLHLFIKRPKLFVADVLIEHLGRHHHADETQLFDGAARLCNSGVHVLQSNQCDAFEPRGIYRAKLGQPIVVRMREVDRQIDLARRAKGNSSGRVDDLDIDPIKIHIFQLNTRIFIDLAQGTAEIAIPGVAGPERATAVFR